MAEAIAAIGVVASVAQLADYGFKLSIRLFAYSEAVYKADKTIKSFSNEVSLTSAVLRELAVIFESKESRFVSPRAIEATEATVKECFDVFNQLNAILEKSMGASSGAAKEPVASAAQKMSTLEKLKWPFMQPKVDLLRSNLDRMKTSLTLMLQVLSFARDVAKHSNTDSTVAMQKQMIEQLAKSEIEATNRYNQLLRLLELQRPSPTEPTTDGSRDVIDTGIDPPPPYINATALPTHSNTIQTTSRVPLLAKLPLCFELIIDVVEQLINQGPVTSPGSDDSNLRYMSHVGLKRSMISARDREARQLSAIFGPSSERLFARVPQDRVALSKTLDQLASHYSRIVESPSSQEASPITHATATTRSSRVQQLEEHFAQLESEMREQRSSSRYSSTSHQPPLALEGLNVDPAARAAVLKSLREEFADRGAESHEQSLSSHASGASQAAAGSAQAAVSLRSSKPTWSKRRPAETSHRTTAPGTPGTAAAVTEVVAPKANKAQMIGVIERKYGSASSTRKSKGHIPSESQPQSTPMPIETVVEVGSPPEANVVRIKTYPAGIRPGNALGHYVDVDELVETETEVELVADSRIAYGFFVDADAEECEEDYHDDLKHDVDDDGARDGDRGHIRSEESNDDHAMEGFYEPEAFVLTEPKMAQASTFGLSVGDGLIADKLLAEWTTVPATSEGV